MGRLSIIFFFTVRLLVLYGMLFSIGLDCHGSCLVSWQTCLHVGGWEVGLRVLLFGKWFLYALCGVSGWKLMRDALKILRALYTWTAAWLAPLVISYLDFFTLFSSSS
jgi:hypothetical protein